MISMFIIPKICCIFRHNIGISSLQLRNESITLFFSQYVKVDSKKDRLLSKRTLIFVSICQPNAFKFHIST